MRRNRISETMQHINTKFVDEANAYAGAAKAVRRPAWVKWGAVAACLCLVAAAMIAMPNLFGAAGRENGSVISGFKTEHMADSNYANPAPGEYFCYVEVNEARKEYAGNDVSFLLSFDVFNGDGKRMNIDELSEEYQRLADLGYKLYYVEGHWTYYGDNQKVYSPVVVGLFTEEELNSFQASAQYGYAFHFETNGDGSSIKINKDDVVSSFNSIRY